MPNITLESKTKPETERKGIKYNDAWHTVVGAAVNYLDDLNTGDKLDVRTDNDGNVVFIRKLGGAPVGEYASTPGAVPEPTEKIELADKVDIVIALMNTNNEMLMKLLGHFNLVDETPKPVM